MMIEPLDAQHVEELVAQNDPPPPPWIESSPLRASIKFGLTFLYISLTVLAALVDLNTRFFGSREHLSQVNIEGFGAKIVTTRDTINIRHKHHQWGVPPLDATSENPPETLLQFEPPVPGKFWAFKGEQGNVVIRLAKPSIVTGIYLEHIHKRFEPCGQISSAPKVFRVLGVREVGWWKLLEERYVLGKFTFEVTGNPSQFFPIKSEAVWELIELEILSNYGADFTSVYRFRVMGHFAPPPNSK